MIKASTPMTPCSDLWHWPYVFVAAILFATAQGVIGQEVSAAEPASDPALPAIQPLDLKPPPYFLLLKRDATTVLTAPLNWDADSWKKFAIGVGAVGVLMLADDAIQKEIRRNSTDTTDRVFDAIEPFGSNYSWGVLAAFYGAGKLFNDPRAEAVAADGLASSLIAAGLITPALKSLTGRARPSQSETAHNFFSGRGSFPSGHTTQAFAVAAVVAEHYDSVWVDALAYGMAGLVGYSRIANNAHYASDVAAGALIGLAVGKAVVRLNSDERNIQFAPMVAPRGAGVSVRIDLATLFGKAR